MLGLPRVGVFNLLAHRPMDCVQRFLHPAEGYHHYGSLMPCATAPFDCKLLLSGGAVALYGGDRPMAHGCH